METHAYELGYKEGFIIGCDEGSAKMPKDLYDKLLKAYGELFAEEYKEGYVFGYKEGYWNG